MQNIISQETEVRDGVVVLKQQVEQTLTRQQLNEQILASQRRQSDLILQSNAVKSKYEQEKLAESEFRKMLDLLPDETPSQL